MALAVSLLHTLVALTLAPLLLGVINRTKAFFAGRHGQPLLQPYRDIAKLLGKGATYSRTTTWIFRAGPTVGLAAALAAAALVPFGRVAAPLAFAGDLVLLVALMGLMRFCTVLAALDTGSSFEGMGASREVAIAALAEPALLLGLAAVARDSGTLSLSTMFQHAAIDPTTHVGAAAALVVAALLVVFLAENARIPIDDPATHLELTMIHEVMVLDHGGPDLAFIQCGAAVKLWVLGALVVQAALPLPRATSPWLTDAAFVAGMLGLAVVTGIVESTMARVRLLRVPQLLVAAGALSAVALVLVAR
ncbi:MAG: NADH-quinone oxidoreductase subunit H [Myxococcota bacterium]